MKNKSKIGFVLMWGAVILFLPSCASLTCNPYSQNEKIKVTLK